MTKAKAASSLILGPFTVNPTGGILQPSASISFFVEFMSASAGSFKTSMNLSIPDTESGDWPIRLSASCFCPALVTKGNDKIFPMLPLAFRADLAKKDITSFLEDERLLHFAPLMLGQKRVIPMVLFNDQPIECITELSVKPKASAKVPFEVSDKLVTIPPNSSKQTSITFCPQNCDYAAGQFEALIKSATPVEPFRFGVEGTGAIPTLVLKTQLDRSKTGFFVNLGRTLLGCDKQRTVTFKNESPIRGTVSVTVKNLVDVELPGIDLAHTFPLEGNEILSLNIVHRPTKVRKSSADVVVTIMENSKTAVAFSCIGEGISEDLVFEGLEGEDCEMHFKDCVVGRSTPIVFTMKNVSDSVIRFVWTSSSDITFSPKVGHIRRHEKKEISAVFYSDKPTKYSGGKLSCQITKIKLVDDQRMDDWDDSKKVVSFVPRSEVESLSFGDNSVTRVMNISPEPAYHVISGLKPKDIPLKAFVVSDNIKCSIDQTEIAFAPTMMFQHRISEFKISNSCQIRFEYQWIVTKFESLRTNYSASWPCAFAIEPSTGFIEAGQSTTFRAIFAPMEVDDFVASFRCGIPFMSHQDPPMVSMNGLSRRPLCHFNLVTSDYLTRRHPDYIYSLPEGVKVVELFAKAVKMKTPKRVEIVNPTSSAYQAKWVILSDYSNGTITCENPSVLVSSGKRYGFTFNFQPSSASLVESLWEFSIPGQNVKIPFLFVGRIFH
jgi:hydrocephalus-inducing protein